jgi:hypothetical protein
MGEQLLQRLHRWVCRGLLLRWLRVLVWKRCYDVHQSWAVKRGGCTCQLATSWPLCTGLWRGCLCLCFMLKARRLCL